METVSDSDIKMVNEEARDAVNALRTGSIWHGAFREAELLGYKRGTVIFELFVTFYNMHLQRRGVKVVVASIDD